MPLFSSRTPAPPPLGDELDACRFSGDAGRECSLVLKTQNTPAVRPPVSYTNDVKREMLQREGLPLELMADFVLDHRIPPALGGAPADRRNLILQDHDDSEAKDRVEVCLARAVCAGTIDLEAARQAIWTDWKSAGRLCDGERR